MTFSLLNTLATLPAAHPLFRRNATMINAGQVRAAAQMLAQDLKPVPGDVVLFTHSLAAFAAGLLGAQLARRNVILPAHEAPDYIAGITAERPFVTDLAVKTPNTVPVRFFINGDVDAGLDAPAETDLTLTFFTSGSTAAPKAVIKSIRQLDVEADMLARAWSPQDGTQVIGTVPHHHIYGILFRLFWPVRTNAISADVMCKYWGGVAEALSNEQGVLISSPAHLGRISPDIACHPKLIFSSGGPLPHQAAADAGAHLGTWPIEVLGSTETGGVAWRMQEGANTAWCPLPGVDITLSEDDEIQVRSPHADGDGLCTLGDRGEVLPDGRFETRGRVGPVVKVEGVRVSLVRVENAISTLGEVAACRTLMIGSSNSRLGAVVALSEAGKARLAADGAFRLGRHLRKSLADALAPAERPKLWQFVDELPMNDQGKTTIDALQSLFQTPSTQNESYPLSDIAQSDTEISAKLVLADDLKWFDGHFPDQPILPGIAQVHMATEIAEQLWGWRPEGANLMKLKFKRVVRPGALLDIHLKRDTDKGHLWFRFEWAGVVTSSGRIGGTG
ncbi:MAG: AMP-binding protein [Pikeienuella sp.]